MEHLGLPKVIGESSSQSWTSGVPLSPCGPGSLAGNHQWKVSALMQWWTWRQSSWGPWLCCLEWLVCRGYAQGCCMGEQKKPWRNGAKKDEAKKDEERSEVDRLQFSQGGGTGLPEKVMFEQKFGGGGLRERDIQRAPPSLSGYHHAVGHTLESTL